MKLFAILLLALLLSSCAHHKPASASPPPLAPPSPPKELSAKPKPRPLKPGDYVLKGAEVLPDGTVVCHKAILVIDSKKKSEDVSTFKCR